MANSPDKNTMIMGRHPILDAIEAGKEIDRLVLQRGVSREFEREIKEISRYHQIPLQIIPKERMDRYTRKNHQGIIGFIALIKYYKIADVLPLIYERSETPLFVMLDGVTDVRNFGAIARSAELCGVHAIIIPDKGAAQINEVALKTSAGALTKIPVCRETSLAKTIDFLKLSGIQIYASSLSTKDPIHALDFTGPTALVIGSEGDGVSKKVLSMVDQHFIIPQKGTTDSFNVSVATGICLYEVMRQRTVI